VNGFGRLQRVIVRPPHPEDLAAWRDYGWHREPDPAAASAEPTRSENCSKPQAPTCRATAPIPGDPDAIYAYDPTLITDAGVIALRPGKTGRRAEPEAFVADLGAVGVPSLGTIRPPGIAEGGDMFFLDDRTLLVGLGYRTNEAGVAQLRELLDPHGIVSTCSTCPTCTGRPRDST
jgi:N-dimethylarginine dimethylaminohydrolase